jgi:hypothetical protein
MDFVAWAGVDDPGRQAQDAALPEMLNQYAPEWEKF